MESEGVIKYQLDWEQSLLSPGQAGSELCSYRDLVRSRGLVGVAPDGLGFGNLSIRTAERDFLITGSQTGHIEALLEVNLAQVFDWELSSGRVLARGPVRPSSEALSHAAFYEAFKGIKGVIHGHSATLWNRLLLERPATDKDATYGTPAMAKEVKRIVLGASQSSGILAMAGHIDGFFAYGTSLSEAWSEIETYLEPGQN